MEPKTHTHTALSEQHISMSLAIWLFTIAMQCINACIIWAVIEFSFHERRIIHETSRLTLREASIVLCFFFFFILHYIEKCRQLRRHIDIIFFEESHIYYIIMYTYKMHIHIIYYLFFIIIIHKKRHYWDEERGHINERLFSGKSQSHMHTAHHQPTINIHYCLLFTPTELLNETNVGIFINMFSHIENALFSFIYYILRYILTIRVYIYIQLHKRIMKLCLYMVIFKQSHSIILKFTLSTYCSHCRWSCYTVIFIIHYIKENERHTPFITPLMP